MLNYLRFLSFFFLLGGFFLLVGCAAEQPMPTETAVISLTETPTNTPPPSVTFTIRATETAVPTVTPSLTPTNVPTKTPMPTPSLPSASVLFVQDGDLQQWIPQTNEIKVLTENIGSWLRHSDDIAIFYRENISVGEKIFYVFHLPTGTEHEIFRTPTTPSATSPDRSITVSPDGRWLAYVSVEAPNDIPIILVHEIVVQEEQINVSSPVLTLQTDPWRWPYDTLSWATVNELSWSDQNGIWIVNLTNPEKPPIIAISPSEHTFKTNSLNQEDQDKEPFQVYSDYLPYKWSSDGRYLLVTEYFLEDGVFRVIERETNRSFEIPDSTIGPLSDGAIWLDDNTLLHFVIPDKIKIWDINLDDTTPILEKTVFLRQFWGINDLQIINEHVRYRTSEGLFDLNWETEELIKFSPNSYDLFHWAPDSQYALGIRYSVVDETSVKQVFLVNLIAGTEKGMDAVFGTISCCWSWYEEK